MADRAAFAQSGMLVNEWSGLFAMTLGAGFVQARHRQSTGWFHDVCPVGVMALHTTHFAFQHRMMLRKMKFRLDFQMTLQTRLRIPAGVDDEFFQPSATAQRYVFAAWPVARFTTVLAWHGTLVQMQARVRTGRKFARDFIVAIGASLVTHKGRPFDLQRLDHGAIGRTGTRQQQQSSDAGHQRQSAPPAWLLGMVQGLGNRPIR
jgi:hypothetical protein